MGASNAKAGWGSRILYNAATTSTPANLAAWKSVSWSTSDTIAELQEVGLPGSENQDIEVTHTLSPNGFKEFIPALKDPGSLSGTANFLVSEYNTLLNTISGQKIGWKVETTSSGAADAGGTADCNVYFMGYLSLSNPSLPVGDRRSVQFTIKVASAPVVDTSTATCES